MPTQRYLGSRIRRSAGFWGTRIPILGLETIGCTHLGWKDLYLQIKEIRKLTNRLKLLYQGSVLDN